MAQIYVIKDTIPSSLPTALPSVEVIFSSDGLSKLLAQGAIEPVVFQYSDGEREAFIRDYTHLIADLNNTHKDKFLWWSTDISSKNRYACALPDLIQELSEIQKAFELYPDKSLLIAYPSAGIYGTLVKMAVQFGRKCIWPQGARQALRNLLTGGLTCLRRLLSNAVRFYARSLWARWAMGAYARRYLSPRKDFYVIKTFSYPSSWDQQGDYADPFFGRLPRILAEDHNVLMLTYQSPKAYREFIRRVFSEKTLVILPVEFFLKFNDILRALGRVLRFHLDVDHGIQFRGMDISGLVAFELARSINGIQIFQLLHYDAVRRLSQHISMTHFLFTFENNPWERMCMLACRHHSPSTKVIGYQHSVVPQAALNMFVHPLEKHVVPLPDKLLVTGDVPGDILQDYGHYPIPVITACAWRYEYLSAIKPRPRPRFQGRVLLVLDGVEQTGQMLKFVLGQLGGHSRYKLRLRCHPALPWEFFSRHHVDVHCLSNVEISKEPLPVDIAWSDLIIYCQTTVVLEAMNLGKPAVNYVTRDILSYDPLFKSKALKWCVAQAGNLSQVLEIIEHLDEESYQKQLEDALGYIKRCFYPPSAAGVGPFR